MAYSKLSISLSPEVTAHIEQRRDPASPNVSGIIDKSLDRYFALLARARAELRDKLSDSECALILDATNGSAFADTVSLSMLWAEIEDACTLDHLDDKWQVDGKALVAKIMAAGMLGQTALIDASERWWNRVSAGEQPGFGELLKEQPHGNPHLS